MITNFKIFEGVLDQMKGKTEEEFMSYNNFKHILQQFDTEPNQHNDLDILQEKLPQILNCNPDDIRFIIIKNSYYTADQAGNVIDASNYIQALQTYIGDTKRKEIINDELSPSINDIVLFEGKGITIIHATHGTMIAVDKNIFN